MDDATNNLLHKPVMVDEVLAGRPADGLLKAGTHNSRLYCGEWGTCKPDNEQDKPKWIVYWNR